MAINKKLIHFKTKVAFNTELNAGNILNTSIVFIQDTQEIWTHGQLYHCSLTKDEVNSLIENSASVATLTKLLENKVDKIDGKGLSSEDYTYEEKMKLLSVDENANNYSLPTASSTTLGGIKVGSNLSINSGVLSAAYNPATTTANGLMSTADKTKLEGIETGAQVNTITSVAGKTGAVTLAKTDVGLENVDNTSDANKPVSTAQATAIADAKKAGTDAQAAVKLEATDRANAIKALDSTVTSTDGKNVLVKVTETDGKITAVNITTDNTAKASDLTTEVTRATNAETDIQTSLLNHLKDKDRKHIPTGGQEKQILTWKSDGTAKWANLTDTFEGLEDLLTYGVEWKDNVADPHITRIGNMSLHKTLPILSQLKGCIAQKDKVIYWLDENDWRFRKDPETITVDLSTGATTFTVPSVTDLAVGQYLRYQGCTAKITAIDAENATITVEWEIVDGTDPTTITQLEIGSRLDGYDGTVRVYCPNFYIKSQIIGNTRRVWLSTVKIDNTWVYQHEILIDAYRSTVLNAVPENMGYLSTLTVGCVISVVNTATYCRGGGNIAGNDKYLTGVDDTPIDIFRTDLGKPRTDMSRQTMRTDSRAAGSEMLSYNLYKNIFYWLYVVEYANFNCQEAYNATLTDEGYHLGGLGASITDMDNWYEYNGGYPLTPCGYGNKLGNRTGLVPLTIPEFTYDADNTVRAAQTMLMARWRGFDNPFGDIWTNLDGIIIERTTGLSNVWTTDDVAEYTDVIGNKTLAGKECLGGGYIKLFDLGETAEIIPSENGNGANTTQYKCDAHWGDIATSGLRTLFVGGGADDGGDAGLGRFHSFDGVSDSYTYVGFRSVSSFVSFSDSEG